MCLSQVDIRVAGEEGDPGDRGGAGRGDDAGGGVQIGGGEVEPSAPWET